MFSQTQEYALRAVVCLAQHTAKPLTTQQLAEFTHVPASYMSKVLQLLGKNHIIRAIRGIGGGYELAIAPETLSVLRVVSSIDPIQRIITCPLKLPSHGLNLCPLHHRMDHVMEDAQTAFGQTMIAELINDPSRSTPLCDDCPRGPTPDAPSKRGDADL